MDRHRVQRLYIQIVFKRRQKLIIPVEYVKCQTLENILHRSIRIALFIYLLLIYLLSNVTHSALYIDSVSLLYKYKYHLCIFNYHYIMCIYIIYTCSKVQTQIFTEINAYIYIRIITL